MHTVKQKLIGVAFSVMVAARFNNEWLFDIVPPAERSRVDYLTSGLHRLSTQYVNTGAVEDTKRICEGIIADFDSKELENARKKIKESLKNK